MNEEANIGYKGVIPVEYKVLIVPDVVDDQSQGGLYLPESARERQQYAMDRGVILAVGEGFFEDIPGPKPKVGDKVIFSKYAGSTLDIFIDGKRRTCRLCNDKDICAVIKEESNGR
jgi:co-chaperonin GroES (HSP10)